MYFLQTTSYQPEKAAKTVYGLDEKEAVEAVVKLKRILDGKGLRIDFNRISSDSMFTDTISFVAQHKLISIPRAYAIGLFREVRSVLVLLDRDHSKPRRIICRNIPMVY